MEHFASDDVEPGHHARADKLGNLRRDTAKGDQVIDGDPLGRELADGDRGAVERARWNDHVDSTAVGQACIHQRLGAIDFAA